MIVALRAMDPARLDPPASARGDRDGVRAALRYLRGEPALLIPLVMMVVIGTLAFNFQVLLPLLGRFTFDGGAGAYTALAVAMAIGSVAGRAHHRRARAGDRAADRRLGRWLRPVRPARRGRPEPARSRCVALVPLGAVSVTFAAGRQLDAAARRRAR